MPALPNARHERFALEIANGNSAAESYVLAGFKKNRHNAAALAREEHILTRVQHILAEREHIHGQATQKAIEATGLTKQWVIDQLIKVHDAALAEQDLGNANRSLELLGKQFGGPGAFDGMNKDELRDFIRREAENLGLSDPTLQTDGRDGAARGLAH
jgi:tagatose-1,6-bisphosphate aldolase non-catalytic subunit AgaZ/GatZ